MSFYTMTLRPLPVLRVARFRLKALSQDRVYSTTTEPDADLRRSYLYVPASSDRMLQKSLTTQSDTIIYDLEDSVAPSARDKANARERLKGFLTGTPRSELPNPARIAVRINATSTPFFADDISQAQSAGPVRTLVLPKVNSVEDLRTVSNALAAGAAEEPMRLVASIESAQALWNIGDIAGWVSEHGGFKGGRLSALLFAAEDYCADTSIIRTRSRQELLYTRSKIVNVAKAFGLQAIDMVCVNYKDVDYLKDECADGRRLGFNGKQAIHPAQVDVIHSTFVPTSEEISRAAKILHLMAQTHAAQKGAVGLDMGDEKGSKEMIDAPMLKQAEQTIKVARAAGLEIPHFAS